MTSPRRIDRPLGGGRALVLLVLAVLAGLVAMHGLGPAAATAPERPAHTAMATVVAHASHQMGQGCLHAGGAADDHGGHVEHADGTCAASGVSTAPALSALTAAGFDAYSAVARANRPGSVTAAGRAPPSLSELQLLRL